MTALWFCTVFVSGRNVTTGTSQYWRIRLNEMLCDKWAYWGGIGYYLHRFNKKVKVKWSHYRPGVAQRVDRGIALFFHDRDTRRGWVFSSTLRPHFTPGKTRYPFYRGLSGPHGRSGRAENLVPTGIRSRTVSRYTDRATRPTYRFNTSMKCRNDNVITYTTGCYFPTRKLI